MKILLNMATMRKTGGLIVGLGLCQGFIDNDTDDEFYLLYPQNCGYEKFCEQKNWHLYPTEEKFGVGLSRIWTDQIKIPGLVKKEKIDVLLTATSMGTYRPGCRHCVFIQLPYLAYQPRELHFKKRLKARITGVFKKFYFRKTLEYTDALIVQTPVMRERMSKKWEFDINRVFPILPAISVPQIESIPDSLPVGAVAKKYLIYPSGAMPHKNLAMIPQILRWLRDNGHEFKFVVTADKNSIYSKKMVALAEKLNVSELILQTGVVDHITVLGYMKNAFALVMPTLLETFGIPYIEAMSLGCPVLTSDLDFAHGVCGSAAKFFNPYSAESIGRCIVECMDAEQAAFLVAEGHKRIEELYSSRTWATVAKEFLDVMKKS